MAKVATKKFSSVMAKPLLDKLQHHAEQNGQSVRFVLESAVKHYLEVVVPSSDTVRPEIIAHMRASMAKNAGLLRRLAKAH